MNSAAKCHKYNLNIWEGVCVTPAQAAGHLHSSASAPARLRLRWPVRWGTLARAEPGVTQPGYSIIIPDIVLIRPDYSQVSPRCQNMKITSGVQLVDWNSHFENVNIVTGDSFKNVIIFTLGEAYFITLFKNLFKMHFKAFKTRVKIGNISQY